MATGLLFGTHNRTAHTMKFTLELGTEQQHRVDFEFNQIFGCSVVKVDGQEVFRKKRWFSEPVVDQFEFQIGEHNGTSLRIEKERKLLFASKYRVYVDNRLTRFYQGV